MRFRTLALGAAIGLGLMVAGAEAKKSSHGAPPTAPKRHKAKQMKPNVKGPKVKQRKAAKPHKVKA
jgi:hypothetical protein